MKFQKGFTIAELVLVLVVLLGAGGWIANIVKILGMSFDPITTELVLRFIGVFLFPLGMIMGYV